jgi:peptide/nickel transport system substrate-binding protein
LAALCWAAAGCRGRDQRCDGCGTLVIAATGGPSSLFPPLVFETVGRDITDQIYERLAYLESGRAPIDTAAYRPGLAVRWERRDSLTWRFHLRPGAVWQDGVPVTAEDVRFSFAAFADPVLDALARTAIEGRLEAFVVDSTTVDIRFAEPSPEQLYDATYHVRIIPRHIWQDVPVEAWPTDTVLARIVGSGPYRLAEWRRPEFLIVETWGDASHAPGIPRVVWRFGEDPLASLNLVLSHEADLLEAAGGPAQVAQLAEDPAFGLESYPSAVYGFLGFQLLNPTGQPHPVLGDREVRRALTMGIDRVGIARSVFGPETSVPPGPMSRLLWIWDDSSALLPFDTLAAGQVLDERGWVRGSDGVRRRNGRKLAFEILVPATSRTRRQLAEAAQAMWRGLGVEATIAALDFPVFQARLGSGRFDSYLGAWLDEPSPRGISDQWTRAGWGVLNYGRYGNPTFDSLVRRATEEPDVAVARTLWRDAMRVLNADAPAIFLYTPTNVAAVHRRLRGVRLDPYSWLAYLSEWSVDPRQALARDSQAVAVER